MSRGVRARGCAWPRPALACPHALATSPLRFHFGSAPRGSGCPALLGRSMPKGGGSTWRVLGARAAQGWVTAGTEVALPACAWGCWPCLHVPALSPLVARTPSHPWSRWVRGGRVAAINTYKEAFGGQGGSRSSLLRSLQDAVAVPTSPAARGLCELTGPAAPGLAEPRGAGRCPADGGPVPEVGGGFPAPPWALH